MSGCVFREGGDLGFEVEADFCGVGGAGLRVGVGLAGAFAVVVGVEGGEAEELLGVGRDVGVDETLVFSEGYGHGGEREVVFLFGELGMEFVADEGALRFGEGDVAGVDAVFEGVGRAVGAAAGLGIEELIVPNEGDVVGGDAGVGFEFGGEMVEAVFEGGESVFGAETAAAAMGGDDEGAEVVGGFGVRGFFFGDDFLEAVGVVGDDAVDAEVDEGADLFGVVGGPGHDAEAGFVELGYVDGGIGAEEGSVIGGEDGSLRAVGFGVGVGGGEESEVGVGWHGEEKGRYESGGSDGD